MKNRPGVTIMLATATMNPAELPRPDRRTVIKWMLTAAGVAALRPRPAFAAGESAAPSSGKGYGADPDLMKIYQPGELWPLTLTDAQRRTAAALCAVIIPAEGGTPSAADLRVHDFIDEWISAPYHGPAGDRQRILDGLAWIDAEAQKRFGRPFADLKETEQAAICDEICHEPKAKPEFKKAAAFFKRYRDLTAGGFYTTPEGMKDIGYVGNVPRLTFDGPPREVLVKLGLV